MENNKNIIIIGAGLVGSMLAIVLAKRGYKVDVFEKRPDLRKTNSYQGRSINLALSDRGWQAIKMAGIENEIREIAIPMFGRMIHDKSGNTVLQPYGKDNQAIYSVSRYEINVRLLALADNYPNISLHFDERCDEVDFEKSTTTFTHLVSGNRKTVNANMILGSDGAFSAARLSKQLKTDRFEYKQFYINCSYKELNITAKENGGFKIEKNALHIWPRGSFMMIALPNMDGSFTCTLFFPSTGENSFEDIEKNKNVELFFKENFGDFVNLMPDFINDYQKNPTSSLVTVKCFPWIQKDNFALIGDAAHAIVPFFGQGMNCGFEDCVVLNSLLDKYNDNWNLVLPEYQELRKPDADAIADLAINNFYEMSNKVNDPKFVLQKKIEAWFSEKYPNLWIPAYSMVTFSPNIRYSEALNNGMKQQAIMDKLLTHQNIEQNWQTEETEKFILGELNKN